MSTDPFEDIRRVFRSAQLRFPAELERARREFRAVAERLDRELNEARGRFGVDLNGYKFSSRGLHRPGPKRPRRRPDSGGYRDGVPVEPNKPSHLSGGAAANMEFRDD